MSAVDSGTTAELQIFNNKREWEVDSSNQMRIDSNLPYECGGLGYDGGATNSQQQKEMSSRL